MQAVNREEVKSWIESNEMAKLVLSNLSGEDSEINIKALKIKLIRKLGKDNVDKTDYLAVFRRLQELHCGSIVYNHADGVVFKPDYSLKEFFAPSPTSPAPAVIMPPSLEEALEVSDAELVPSEEVFGESKPKRGRPFGSLNKAKKAAPKKENSTFDRSKYMKKLWIKRHKASGKPVVEKPKRGRPFGSKSKEVAKRSVSNREMAQVVKLLAKAVQHLQKVA